MDKAAFEGFVIEVVRRIEGEQGFKVLRAAGSSAPLPG